MSLDRFKSSEIYPKITDYLATDEGHHVQTTFKETVDKHCGKYVRELEGLAKGAGVSYDDLFLFNCKPEFADPLSEVSDGRQTMNYVSLYDGCTNISMTTEDGKVLLAHNEDIRLSERNLGVMLSVEITNEKNECVEQWTDYYVPGILPGSKMSFNSFGVMLGGTSIVQQGVNLKEIPRKFLCRSLLNVRDSMETIERLQSAPGIATAFCFHYLQKTRPGVDNTVIEVAGTPDGSRVQVYRPSSFYHHCNMFQHIRYPCRLSESSVHRAAALSQFVNRGEIQIQLLNAISNQQDSLYPVYRNGQPPDYAATVATGVFDALDGTLEVYTDVPSRSKPIFFGQICHRICNNCKPGTKCEQESLFCTFGCKDGLSGNQCDIPCESSSCLSCNIENASLCERCKKDQNCDCPAYCLAQICNDSYCSEGCLPGYCGDICENVCPESCSSGEYNRQEGICTEACMEGFSGQQCDILCHSRCKSCDKSNPVKCLACKNNQTCEDMCPAGCLLQKCTDQYCVDGCLPGYWGDSCNKRCPETCTSGTCDRENGKCSEENDILLRCKTLEMLVAVQSVLLVVAMNAVVYLLCRQRCTKSSNPNTAGNLEQESKGTQLLASSDYIMKRTPENNEYLTPVHPDFCQSKRYVGIINPDLFPMPTIGQSGKQNQIVSENAALESEDQYEKVNY